MVLEAGVAAGGVAPYDEAVPVWSGSVACPNTQTSALVLSIDGVKTHVASIGVRADDRHRVRLVG